MAMVCVFVVSCRSPPAGLAGRPVARVWVHLPSCFATPFLRVKPFPPSPPLASVGTASMIHLSVNVNKVATLRNSRGGTQPRVLDAVDVCLRAGVFGITVHPRADRRHITPEDVRDIKRVLDGYSRRVEFNIEGDPRPDLIDLVLAVQPDQCTLVPVVPGEITSQAGWREGPSSSGLPSIV